MTKGEYRVGITFNPSGDDRVTNIKNAAALLIDLIEDIPGGEVGTVMSAQGDEIRRLRALAQTAAEEAAMWAVKAATKPPLGV